MRTLVLIALIGLSACSDTEVLATCKGPVFALNTGRWQATPDDLKMPTPIGGHE
ncbi:MAG: type IV secretion system lipoprotein VirB7 [Janthinobacterium lividum]